VGEAGGIFLRRWWGDQDGGPGRPVHRQCGQAGNQVLAAAQVEAGRPGAQFEQEHFGVAVIMGPGDQGALAFALGEGCEQAIARCATPSRCSSSVALRVSIVS